MQDSRDSLKEFLEAHADEPDVIPAVMRGLDPLYAHAESGIYRLASEELIGTRAIADAIASATGSRATEVTLTLMSRIGHVTANDEQRIWRRLMNDRGRSLGRCLRDEHHAVLQERLEQGRHRQEHLPQMLWDRLERGLFSRLDGAIGRMLGDNAPPEVFRTVRDSITSTAFFFTGLAIAADGKRTMRLTGLMQMIARTVPLHAVQSEPHRWHVLAR